MLSIGLESVLVIGFLTIVVMWNQKQKL